MSAQSGEILSVTRPPVRRHGRGRSACFRAGYDARLAHVAGITLYESFEAAEPVWRAFEARATGTAFQSFDWLSAWYARVGKALGIAPAIAVVTRQGEPVLLAPLGIERRSGLRRLVWLGGKLADYKAPLVDAGYAARMDGEEFARLWHRLRRALPRHDLIMLENQPVSLGSPSAPVANPFALLPGARAPDAAYLFDLPPDFETFSQRYRAETRRIDRAKLRKLEAKGEVTFRHAETPGDMISMVEGILARKAEQLAAQGITSIFDDPDYLAAWRDLAALPAERRLLDVAELRLDGAFLSGSISHVRHDHSTLMVHTYDATKFPRLSPGRLHLLKHLQSSIERGIAVYDLSVGHAAYKESFCDAPMEMRHSIMGASIAGYPVALALRAALAAKRHIKADPRLMAFLRKLRSLRATQGRG